MYLRFKGKISSRKYSRTFFRKTRVESLAVEDSKNIKKLSKGTFFPFTTLLHWNKLIERVESSSMRYDKFKIVS